MIFLRQFSREGAVAPPGGGASGEDSEWDNRISAASSNYRPILLSFRDMTKGRTTEDGWTDILAMATN